jgi:hypothetical protein
LSLSSVVCVSGFSLEGGQTKYSLEVAALCIRGGAKFVDGIESVDDAAAALIASAVRDSRTIQRLTVASGT